MAVKMNSFGLRLLNNKRIGIREHVRVGGLPEESKATVILCLNSDFNLVMPHLLINDDFVSLDIIAESEGYSVVNYLSLHKVKEMTFYYPMEQVTYVCSIRLSLRKRKIISKSINIFLPVDVEYDNVKFELTTRDVTHNFQLISREQVFNSLSQFVFSRI